MLIPFAFSLVVFHAYPVLFLIYELWYRHIWSLIKLKANLDAWKDCNFHGIKVYMDQMCYNVKIVLIFTWNWGSIVFPFFSNFILNWNLYNGKCKFLKEWMSKDDPTGLLYKDWCTDWSAQSYCCNRLLLVCLYTEPVKRLSSSRAGH